MQEIDFSVQRVRISNAELILLPQKAILWPEKNLLLLADLHLGKISHFRKAGIPLPQRAEDENLERLRMLLQKHQPEKVCFLGDLFHSEYNASWQAFTELLQEFQEIDFQLIMGNHDILDQKRYEECGLSCHQKLEIPPFSMTHEPLELFENGMYNLCGHIHPGVRMNGKARQSLRLPCFYFGKTQAILPAFGVFTGKAIIRPVKGDEVYVIAEDKVISVY